MSPNRPNFKFKVKKVQLAAWKPLKSGSWRGLCVLLRFCFSRYLKLIVLFPEHFICHATETNLKTESTEFQHKLANKISQKDFHSIKLKTIFLVSLFKQITWSISFEYIVLILLCLFVSTTQLSHFCKIVWFASVAPPLS